MPVILPLRAKRTTRAALNAQKAASGLLQGEPYLITDESRLAVGTAANNYADMATKAEVDAKAATAHTHTLAQITDAVALIKNYASINQGATDGEAANPDLADEPVKLIRHANMPGGAVYYWHVTTTFYASRTSASNRGQIAVQYNAGNQVWARSIYGGTWTPWVRLDNAGMAPLASPALTGTPTAPTAAAGTSTTQLATTAFVAAANTASATKLATARTLTVGSSAKAFDGTANVAWSLAEMGAQPALVSGSNIKTVNGASLVGAGAVVITGDGTPFVLLPYASRGDLRSQAGVNGGMIAVDELGLFRFAAGATDPDDDESCFATAGGRWLLQAAHPDMADTVQQQQLAPLRAALAALQARAPRDLGVTAPITSLAGGAQAAFSAPMPSARPGRALVLTAPADLPQPLTARVHCPQAGQVTITIRNHSAAAAAVAGEWLVTAF